MGHSRPRYNVKGRLASQEKQQQKRRKLTHDDELSTALIITDEDRARARAQLLAQRGADEDGEGSTKKLSSKQKKRLDAFVQRSLKKDARRELLASLAQTQAPASELAKMQQSAQLGSKRLRTASERDEHREQGERARAHTRAGKRKRVRRDYNSASEDDSDEEGVQYDAQHAESLEIVATPEPPPPSARTRAPAPPLDVSGTVGVVDVVPGAPSTSNGAAPSASASAPAVAGSALAQGTRIQVIKRAPRAEKGKLRDFYLAGRNKKVSGCLNDSQVGDADFSSVRTSRLRRRRATTSLCQRMSTRRKTMRRPQSIRLGAASVQKGQRVAAHPRRATAQTRGARARARRARAWWLRLSPNQRHERRQAFASGLRRK